MNVLVNIFLRGIGMTLKMSIFEILHIVNQHRMNLNVHLCVFKRPVYFTSNLLTSMLSAFINAKISMSLLKKRNNLGVLLTGVCFFSLQRMIPPCF